MNPTAILIRVVRACRPFADGWNADFYDAGTDSRIGCSMLYRDAATAREDGVSLAAGWYPRATVTVTVEP